MKYLKISNNITETFKDKQKLCKKVVHCTVHFSIASNFYHMLSCLLDPLRAIQKRWFFYWVLKKELLPSIYQPRLLLAGW